ncbi:hypothetical protein GA0070616_5292 [Micromonospora nigra]|uniref:Uncharacterized protein n=1 Tax=Micromonospora nigra TaxID=145857 RepID=A0A1C6T1P6_9ACTN|nr:hypothetical protein [Micromonospora nigra]SCL35688.1 hypothetical protein GA0070616_5292 [Micromonospora nigra]
MASDANGTDGASPAPDVEMGPARGQRRSRRFLLLGIMTTVVAVAAGLTVWAAGRGPEPDTSDGPPRSVPAQFAPGQQLFRLGHLPGPARLVRYDTEHDMHTMTVNGTAVGASATEQEGGRSSAGEWHVEVRMAARGIDVHRYDREYDEEAGLSVPGDSVAPVQGRPAFQNELPDGRVLSWEYAPDAWMRLTVHGVDRPEEITRQVAEGVRWEETPLALPFRAVELPDDAVLGGVVLEWAEDGPLRAYSSYLLPGPIEDHQSYLRYDLVVGLSTESLAGGRHSETDDVTVSGRAATAIDWRRSGEGIYRVAQLPGGCATCVAQLTVLSERADTAVGGRDDALELAASIRLVDGHEDPARWRPR